MAITLTAPAAQRQPSMPMALSGPEQSLLRRWLWWWRWRKLDQWHHRCRRDVAAQAVRAAVVRSLEAKVEDVPCLCQHNSHGHGHQQHVPKVPAGMEIKFNPDQCPFGVWQSQATRTTGREHKANGSSLAGACMHDTRRVTCGRGCGTLQQRCCS